MNFKIILVFLFVFALGPAFASLFGMVHDQLTYTISPEYYTKFKFYQFGLATNGNEAIFPYPRLQVCTVGHLATWWMGVPIGFILLPFCIAIKNISKIIPVILKTYSIISIVAICTGLIGLVYGKLYLVKTGVNWLLPPNLIDKNNFIAVGSMHNFSYLGGGIGLIVGIVFLCIQIKKINFNK